MARLSPTERESLRNFAGTKRIKQPRQKPMPLADFLRTISNLPESMRPPKPIRFVGKDWKL